MKLFKRKPTVTLVEFSEPYVFEPGMRYVMEVNTRMYSIEQITDLQSWFTEQGIIVKLIGNSSEIRGLNPVTATKKREYSA